MAIGIIGIGYHTAHLVRGGKHLPVGIVGVRNAGAISISSLCYTAQSIVFLRSDAAQCVSEGTGLVQGIILRRGLVSLRGGGGDQVSNFIIAVMCGLAKRVHAAYHAVVGIIGIGRFGAGAVCLGEQVAVSIIFHHSAVAKRVFGSGIISHTVIGIRGFSAAGIGGRTGTPRTVID
ncbi:hypothetical protein, partial [Flavonifractor plautii]|uniref:hypothetical protein n=1 Tax=Flavonifractor plautii TaxID=292800 RepID=UPI003F63B0CC